MRIAMTQHKMRWAGQPKHILDLALGLRERGHEILLVSPPGSEFSKRAKAEGLRVREIRMTSLPVQIGATFQLGRLLRRNRTDILHCHDSRDHQIGCVAARLGGVRGLVRTKHNTLPLRNAGSRWINNSLTSRVICISEAVKKVLVESGIDPAHVSTVYNFVDPEVFQPGAVDPELRHSLSLPKGAPVIGTVGRLHRAKGIEDLIRAIPAVAAEFPELRVLLVGSSYDRWPPLARELGVEDHCVFTGPVRSVPNYLHLMDVAVFPSLREGFGLSILEATAARVPVVATRVGGVPELIRDGVNGLLVDPRSPGQLASAILRLLRDPDLCHALVTEAYNLSTEVFSRKRCLDATEAVYRSVLGE